MDTVETRPADDILAIQRVLARYCVLLDMGDMEAFAALWAPDAEFHLWGKVWTGPEAIVARVSQGTTGLHMASLPDLTLDGDRAVGRQNFVFVEGTGHGLRIGRYDDEFVRLADGWRFASRAISFVEPPSA